jgi:hypothetical protein
MFVTEHLIFPHIVNDGGWSGIRNRNHAFKQLRIAI